MQLAPRIHLSRAFLNLLLHLALGAGVGFLWYLFLFGRFPLYVTHVGWLYQEGGDVLQHQLGWEWFRQEPWRFPLGSIAAYGYPTGTSVTFMDAIPLMAIPFKLLAPWLEEPFQYYGLWVLASLAGQMFFGLLILNEFTRSWPLKLLGASLLVLSPPLIFRAFHHNALSAHWIVLATIWFILREDRQSLWRGAWPALFAVAVLVHAYFVPMLLPLWLVGLFFRYRSQRPGWGIALDVLSVPVAILVPGYITGLFGLPYSSLAEVGYGLFTWNLNGFFNPFYYSTFLKTLATGTSGQYEGFSYLGLGNLILVAIAVYQFFQEERLLRKWPYLLPFGAASLVLALFALSHKAFFNDLLLWEFSLSQEILHFFNLFRSSGRLIWPVFYFVVLFGIFVTLRSTRYPLLVLAAAVLVQVIDLQPLYTPKRLSGPVHYESGMQAGFWQSAAETNRHIVVLPVEKFNAEFEPVALYAVHHGLTMNHGYFARADHSAAQSYAEQVWHNLQANHPDDETLYFLTDLEKMEYFKANLRESLLVCDVDEYDLLISRENALVRSGFDLSPYCQ